MTLKFNFLGLTINEYLDWSCLCNKIAFKISRTLGIINRLKHELPTIILKLMYDALIMSLFQYSITSWGYSCYRLFKLQKRVIRIVTLSKYNAHTDPLFKLNQLLKIEYTFEIQCLKFYYKYRKAILLKYLIDMFTENRDVHNHNTRQTSHLHHGVTRTVSARNRVRYSLPVLIDKTPNDVLQRVTHRQYITTRVLKQAEMPPAIYGKGHLPPHTTSRPSPSESTLTLASLVTPREDQ